MWYNDECGLVRRNEERDTSTRLSTTSWMSSTRMSAEMNPASKSPNTRLSLPHIQIDHSLNANAFRMQIGFMDITWDGIYIMDCNARSYLKRPDEFIADFQEAVDAQLEMRNGNAKFNQYIKQVPPYQYWFYNGLMHATERAPYDREDSDPCYLSIFQYDMRAKDVIGATHYIRLDEHNQRLNASYNQLTGIAASINDTIERELSHGVKRLEEHNMRLVASSGQMVQLAKSIDTKIENGVASGIQKAVRDSQMTLDQVYSEREKLERQQAEIERRLKQLQEIEKVARERRPRSSAGYVYLVQSPTTYWKIGRTNNPDDRMKTFSVKLPFEVKYKHLIKTSDMYTLESNLHVKYASRRVDGEWFALTDDDVNEICAMKGDE